MVRTKLCRVIEYGEVKLRVEEGKSEGRGMGGTGKREGWGRERERWVGKRK